MSPSLRKFQRWANRHRTLLLRGGIGLIAIFVIIQLFYPSDRLPLYASIDGVNVSGWKKTDATKHLDELARNQSIDVKVGDTGVKAASAHINDIGLKVSNKERVEKTGYPWFVKVIPMSIVWLGLIQQEGKPSYSTDNAKAEAYLTGVVGKDCSIAPVDASLKVEGEKLTVVKAKSGGTCKKDEAVKAVTTVRPVVNKPASIEIPVKTVIPAVSNQSAEKLGEELTKASKDGVKLMVAGKQQNIDHKEVLSWLTFKPDGSSLAFEINSEIANAYMAKNVTPAVTKPSGITKVSTSDFTEISRNEGATGQTLALQATLNDIRSVLTGDKKTAAASVTALPPKVEYSRTYSKTSTGIAAQLKFYDDDNAGVFGVSFVELGGQGLNARHNGDRQFVTASTYKLFVAFSVLKRVDAGQMKWDDADIASGRNLSTCFDDMIVKSDNACAEALLKKIGASELNADIKSLGLSNTAFRSDNNMTTPNDLANYLTQLEKGIMPIKPESRERLLAAMKRNVYRQGVPSGSSGQTADKVGFLFGFLHDAAIVYSPKGTYVLTVMTDGSSWANIADLTRKIEALS